MLTTLFFLGFSYCVFASVVALGFGDSMSCFDVDDYVGCGRRAARNIVLYVIVGVAVWSGMLWLILKLWDIGSCSRKS